MSTLYSVQVTGESVAAATVETLCQIVASSSKKLQLVRWGVSFNGADPTKTPVQVELLRLTGDGSSSAYVPKKLDPTAEAALATGRTAHTAEPPADDILETYYVSPAGGGVFPVYAPDERIVVGLSGRVGIRVLANDAVNANAYMIFDE